MNLIKGILLLTSLFSLTACPDGSNTGNFPNSNETTSVTTCSGGTTPILNAAQYFPLIPNSRWVYEGSATQSTINLPYINEVNITGVQTIAGVQTTIFTESNYTGAGADTSYVSIDPTNGAKEWSIVLDGTASTPIDTAMFPLSVGKKCTQSYSNFDFGPIDPYTANSPHIIGSYDITVTVAAVEPVTVPAGIFSDAIRFEVSQSIVASAIVDGKTIDANLNSTITEWNAPDIGRLKTIYNSTSSGSGAETATEELTDYYIPIEQASSCIAGDAVTAAMGYGLEYYPLDTYSTIMMDSYTNVGSSTLQKHTTLLENKGLFNIQGTNTQHTHEVRSSLPPVITDTYTSTDNLGAYDWTYLASQAPIQPLTPPIPLTLVQFPLSTNAQCTQVITNVNFGDVDYDGVDDTGYIEFSSDIYSFGTKNIVLGNYPNTFQINKKATHRVRLSFGGIKSTSFITSEWRAPQIGLIKKTSESFKPNYLPSPTVSPSINRTESELSNSFLKLPYAANDIIYDTYSNKLYASINSNAPSYANHVIAIDPATGQVTSSILAGINPNVLALSSDSTKLYVGMLGEAKVRSINLPTMTLNPSFTLGGDPVFGTLFYAEDLAVSPNDPYTVAVAKFDLPNRNHQGISIYKNSVELTNKTNSTSDGNVIIFGAPNQLFGLPTHSIPPGLSVYTVGISGIAQSSSNWGQGVGIDMLYNSGKVYGSSGKIFNPLTLLSTQDFTLPSLTTGVSLMFDSTANSITFLTTDQGSIYGQLYTTQSFDLTTKATVGLSKPYLFQYYDGINAFDLSASSLQNMGSNGFAFRVFEAYNSLPISEWGIIIQK